ncbi:MAG: hypothetical protein ACM3SS_11510 [Rhodospirillaceae bacterium]
MQAHASSGQILDRTDVHSPTWAKIKAHLEERLAEHHAANEHDIDAMKTAKLRGRIAELHYVLSLAEPPETPVAPPII